MGWIELERWIAPLKRRIYGMISPGVVTGVNDTPAVQTIDVTVNGQEHSDTDRLQSFGLTSFPKPGGQVLVTFMGGDKERPVAIMVDDGTYRVKLSEGEVAVYNAFGAVIKLALDGTISIGDGTALAPTAGVVTGECLDPFTGVPHADVSLKVKAIKV
jgi:phage baseplate assembly protein V